MATTVTQGNRLYGTDTNLQVVPIQDRIPLLSPATNPITAAIMFGNQIFQSSTRTKKLKVRKEKLTVEVPTWRTGNLVPKSATLAANASASATTITVGSGEANYFLADGVLQNARTREQVIVSSVDTSTNILTII